MTLKINQVKPSVRHATFDDLGAMVDLSQQKRDFYEKAQPQFWRGAAAAQELQKVWFEKLLDEPNSVMLVCEEDYKITGFIIGQIIKAPEVYDPGGLTVMVDDFCVMDQSWESAGMALIEKLQSSAKHRGAVQIVAVCGSHDSLKKKFLDGLGLSLASEWYVRSI